jgi:CRISPR-associated protein Cas1
MYAMRFTGEETSGLTMQQLRGREGARVRRSYREHSARTGVTWTSRTYTPGQFDQSDRVNQALSSATTALYGAVHAVVVALGCSPGLGFVHTGHDRSFVYDVADLYKAELAIPTAFDVAASDVADVGAFTRRAMRDRIHSSHLLERCARDIQTLLMPPDVPERDLDVDVVGLWDGGTHVVEAGYNHEDLGW